MQDWEQLLEQARKDWEKIEAEIRNRLQSRIARKLIPEEEMEDLRKMEVPTPVDPNWVRPFFYRPILPVDEMFYKKEAFHLEPDLLISSSKPWMRVIRRIFQPLRKLLVNIEAVLHRQSIFNEQQVALDDRMAHHIRLLHQLTNQLVAEITKLRLEHEAFKTEFRILNEQFEWYRQRHQALERHLRPKTSETSSGKDRHV